MDMKKGMKKKARKKLAAAIELTEHYQAELDRVKALDSSLSDRLAKLSAATEERAAAQIDALNALADRAERVGDRAVMAIDRSAEEATTAIESATTRIGMRVDEVLADADRRSVELVHELEVWNRAAEQRVTAAADAAIAHIEEQAVAYSAGAQQAAARASQEFSQQARELVERAAARLDEIQSDVERRADDLALSVDPDGSIDTIESRVPVPTIDEDAPPPLFLAPREPKEHQPEPAADSDPTPASEPPPAPARSEPAHDEPAHDEPAHDERAPAVAWHDAPANESSCAQPPTLPWSDRMPADPPIDTGASDPLPATTVAVEERHAWSPDRTGVAVGLRIHGAELVASLTSLARTAADGWVRAELILDALRLTVLDVSGWWEYHDVPVQTTQRERTSTTVEVAELLQAVDLEYQRADDGLVSVTVDHNVAVGTTLVLARTAPIAMLSGARRKIERVELRGNDRSGVVLDSQLGRFVIPSRLVSVLRSRRADAVDLVMVGEQPCLCAQVSGPSTAVAATLLAPLHDATSGATSAPEERRDADRSAIHDLVGALSSTTSAEELASIIATGVGYARRRAAAHPALPPEMIDETLRDGTEAMRAAAASNPSIAPRSVALAAGDDAAAVRAAVAGNGRVGPEVLRQLAGDPAPQVRVRAATNPMLSHDALRLLAGDADPGVRAAVAGSEHASIDVLNVLAHDADPAVCATVADNPRCPIELFDELIAVVPDTVLVNPRAPEHLLNAGSQVRSAQLRAAVAANPSTPARQLEALSRDLSAAVLVAVAENTSAPPRARRRARRKAARFRAVHADYVGDEGAVS